MADKAVLVITAGQIEQLQSGDVLISNARIAVRVNSGADVGVRRRLNFIAGPGISIGGVDDGAAEEIDLTVSGTGSLVANTFLLMGA